MKKKALILTWDSFQDHEVVYPYYRVQENGLEVDIMSDKIGRIHGILGVYMESTISVFDLNDESKFQKIMNDYDLLILPGGVKSLEKLRQELNALKFISEWNSKKKNHWLHLSRGTIINFSKNYKRQKCFRLL
jgi:protease I